MAFVKRAVTSNIFKVHRGVPQYALQTFNMFNMQTRREFHNPVKYVEPIFYKANKNKNIEFETKVDLESKTDTKQQGESTSSQKSKCSKNTDEKMINFLLSMVFRLTLLYFFTYFVLRIMAAFCVLFKNFSISITIKETSEDI